MQLISYLPQLDFCLSFTSPKVKTGLSKDSGISTK